jgi:UDP-N-acetylglucosamine 4-epimerase|tara:strand:- start:1929 stop:2909 length:981 start_codon:yes stop_codon:yes gene_type:complete
MFKYKFHNQDLSQSKFLITGGAGFIGSNITEYLIKHKAGFVRVLDNLSTGNIQNIEKHIGHSNFEFIDGDIRDFEICKKATENIDYITHQAALGSVPRSIKDPLLTNSVNISGFLNILTAAKEEKGLKKFIYAASSSTYGDHPGLPKIEEKIGQPLSPYAITKYVNELYGDVFSRIYNFHSIGLRYFNVFGPNQSPDNPYAAVIPLFLRAAKMKINPIINGDGNTSRDFTYVENAVEANIKALLNTKDVNSHEVLNIAFGAQTSLKELWEIICSISKLSIKPEFREERIGDVKHSLAEISKAKRLIGYDPKVNIKKGLELTIDSYK